jgi:hypothetical protein
MSCAWRDLLGYRPILSEPQAPVSPRPPVCGFIFRRRKKIVFSEAKLFEILIRRPPASGVSGRMRSILRRGTIKAFPENGTDSFFDFQEGSN